jgi:O-antigen/teichoic acid export membrane protein
VGRTGESALIRTLGFRYEDAAMTLPGQIAVATAERPPSIGAWLTRYRYAVAAADQIAISLLNFGLTFVLLRLLPATDFGVIALWMAVSNLVIAAHMSVVGAPLGIHVPAEADEVRRQRLGEAVASANILVIGFSVLLVVIVNCVSDAEWAPKALLAAAAVPVFIGAGLFREYYRGIAFGRQDMVLLLIVDAPYLAVTLGCILAMVMWPKTLSGLSGAFFALAAGAAAAQLCGALRSRGNAPRPWRRGWLASYRTVADDLGWALTGVVLGHIQKRSYVYITTSLVGLAQLASINAVAVLFRPAQILLTAWRRSALPEFSALVAAGQVEALARKLALVVVVATAGCAGWCAALWAAWQVIAVHLFAGKYSEGVLLLLPWAIAICLDTVDFVLGTALQAAREFRYLAGVTMITAPISAVATAWFTVWHGYTWTIYGLAIGSGVSVILVIGRLWKVRRRMLTKGIPAAHERSAGSNPV